ncbi:MAG: hypothetical protein IJY52_03535, partial [Anaerotignum sp.]|nr:hypothetical protein [Anaerotignum sp.]
DFSIEMEFFGHPIKWGWMVLALAASTLIIGTIMVLYYYKKKGNIFAIKKKIKKKKGVSKVKVQDKSATVAKDAK